MGHEGRGHQVGICLLVTHGGSRLVSADSSLARACSLLCPYIPEDVRTRVPTVDDEVRAAGPLTVRREGFLCHPPPLFWHLTAPPGGGGGATSHPFPDACVSTSEQRDTAVSQYLPDGSGGYKPAARSRPPGHFHPRAPWRLRRSHGCGTGGWTGDFRHPLASYLDCLIPAARGPPNGAVGARPLCAQSAFVTSLGRMTTHKCKGCSGWRRWGPSPQCVRQERSTFGTVAPTVSTGWQGTHNLHAHRCTQHAMSETLKKANAVPILLPFVCLPSPAASPLSDALPPLFPSLMQ